MYSSPIFSYILFSVFSLFMLFFLSYLHVLALTQLLFFTRRDTFILSPLLSDPPPPPQPSLCRRTLPDLARHPWEQPHNPLSFWARCLAACSPSLSLLSFCLLFPHSNSHFFARQMTKFFFLHPLPETHLCVQSHGAPSETVCACVCVCLPRGSWHASVERNRCFLTACLCVRIRVCMCACDYLCAREGSAALMFFCQHILLLRATCFDAQKGKLQQSVTWRSLWLLQCPAAVVLC